MMNLKTDGVVNFKNDKNNREFTRLIGGFGDDNPMFSIWQSGELLGLRTGDVIANFERNESNFEKDVDFIDLKSLNVSNVKTENVEITTFLKSVGITHHKYGRTDRWLAFSFSGMMKLVKIATTKESWDIFNNFLEDYFKTKAENKMLKVTLKEQIEFLKKEKATYLGLSFMEQDLNKRQEFTIKSEEITTQIIQLEKQLTEEVTVEKYKIYEDKYKAFLDKDGCCTFEDASKILSTRANEDGVKIKVNKISLPKILREKGILSKNKSSSGSYKNLPNSGYEVYFNTTPTEFVIYKNEEAIPMQKTQTRVNRKGLDYIYDLLFKDLAC